MIHRASSFRNFPRPAVMPVRDDCEASSRRIHARMRGGRPLAPADFHGIQKCYGICPDIELFNLTANVGDHPAGSTVSRETLEQLGFFVPPLERVNQGFADGATGEISS